MPDLNDRLMSTAGADITSPVMTTNAQFPPTTSMEPIGTGFTRCPMPPIWQSNPDSLRQFYRSGMVPQIRIYSQALKGN